MKRKIIIVLAIIILIPILFVAFVFSLHYFFAGDDLKEVNDKDLLLEKVEVPDADNAYLDFQRLEKLKLSETASSAGAKNLDPTQLKNLIDNNKEALEILKDFSEKKYFLDPMYDHLDSLILTSYMAPRKPISEAARILWLKAQYELESKNDYQAYDDVKILAAVAHKLTESRVSFVTYLVGVRIEKNSLEILEKIVGETRNTFLLRKIQADIEFFKTKKNNDLFKDEYLMIKNSFSSPDFFKNAENIPGKNMVIGLTFRDKYYYKQNQTLDIMARHIRDGINNYQKDCSEENVRYVRAEKNITYPSLIFNMIFTRNYMGILLTDMVKIDMSSVKDKRCDNEKLLSDIESRLDERLKK